MGCNVDGRTFDVIQDGGHLIFLPIIRNHQKVEEIEKVWC